MMNENPQVVHPTSQQNEPSKPTSSSKRHGVIFVIGVFNLLFALGVGGFFAVFAILTILVESSPGLFSAVMIVMALLAGIQVFPSVGMLRGQNTSLQAADHIAKLFVIPISASVIYLVAMPLSDPRRGVRGIDWMAIVGYGLLAVWPVILMGVAARRRDGVQVIDERQLNDLMTAKEIASVISSTLGEAYSTTKLNRTKLLKPYIAVRSNEYSPTLYHYRLAKPDLEKEFAVEFPEVSGARQLLHRK